METKVNNIDVKTVPHEWDVYFDMALAMLEEIMKNNAAGKKTVMIVPVGPTDQYPILARLVNQLRVSLKDVWFFNMDEYMWSESKMIEKDHVMSFERRMNDEFYSRVKAGKPAKVRLATMTGAVADGVFELEAYDLEFDGRYFWFTDYVARPQGESVHHVERSYRYTYMLKDQTVTLGRKDLDVFVLTLSDQYTWSYMDRTADDAALASDFPFIVPNEVVYFELSE